MNDRVIDDHGSGETLFWGTPEQVDGWLAFRRISKDWVVQVADGEFLSVKNYLDRPTVSDGGTDG